MTKSELEQPGLVSIVIPTYNDDPNHLIAAVDSALNQSYAAIEVIVVDDGSTSSSSRDVLTSLAGVQLIHQANRGPGEARNAGIRRSRGEFVLPLDGDDWIDSDVVELLVAAMGIGDIVAAFPLVRRFGASEGIQHAPRVVRLADIAVTNQVVATALFRRSSWAQVGGYRTSDIVDEDWYMWLKILGQTHGKMVQVPEAVLHYRLRHGSRSGARTSDPGEVQQHLLDEMPDLACELYTAAALEAQALRHEVEELRAFYRAWSPRLAPLLRLRDLVRRSSRGRSSSER